ncbi:MAG: beta-ketoacyl-[acyl-carrier-protein] synthase II, partial [Mesorhizobium sp.]
MRRVVVTGLGLLSPFGMGVEHSWKELLSGRSAACRITEFEVDDLACKIAHVIPRGDGSNGTFNPEAVLEPKELRKIGDFILYGIAAADEALADSGWKPETHEDQCATGVLIGSGIGGIDGIAENAMILKERGPRRISPFFIPGQIINLVSGQVSIRHGLKGPNHAVVTACSTGAHAIGDAARLIIWGDADVMVAGGAEAPITRLSMAGFAACRALSTERNDAPEIASRPYDRDRDGFVMGEGAGVVVLEELEHAKARGAKIYAEVTGYGLTGDAYHITAPAEDGDGAFRCMAAALNRAKLSPADIDYINAHGTSTMADTIELGAVERLVGNAASKISMSSTKSSIGHLLGAAGAAEAIFSILAIRDNIAPATINLDNPERETAIDLV